MAVRPVHSVDTALRVLEAVAELQPVGVSVLARHLGIDKNAAQRSLVTLGESGWIRHPNRESSAWEITARALAVGRRYATGLVDRARPQLEALQRATGETVVLFAVDEARIVALDVVDSPHSLRLTVPLGTSVAISRIGALDAFLAPADVAAIPEPAIAPDPATLAAALRNGYYVLDDEYPSSVAVGAPVRDERHRVVGSLVVVAPRSRLAAAERRRVGELVSAAAAAVL